MWRLCVVMTLWPWHWPVASHFPEAELHAWLGDHAAALRALQLAMAAMESPSVQALSPAPSGRWRTPPAS